jgi:hypothetical protein
MALPEIVSDLQGKNVCFAEAYQLLDRPAFGAIFSEVEALLGVEMQNANPAGPQPCR